MKINDVDYDSDKLSKEDKMQFQMLAVANAEIKRLQAHLTIDLTAKNAYAQSLIQSVNSLPQGDTIKL